MRKPPRVRQIPGCRPRAAKGGANWHRSSSRHRHAAQGAGTSGVGWRAAGVCDVQLCVASYRESSWGSGEIDKVSKRNGYV